MATNAVDLYRFDTDIPGRVNDVSAQAQAGGTRLVNLNITTAYKIPVMTHECANAEFVQNLRDAIIATNNLPEEDFVARRFENQVENKKDIVYFVQGQNSKVLGYIWYRGKDGAGKVELVNYCSVVADSDLALGAGTKRQNESMAGFWGHGMKMAALSFLTGVQTHNVRIRSRDLDMTFFLDGQVLWVRVDPVDIESDLHKAESPKAQHLSRLLRNGAKGPDAVPIFDPSLDVQVTIGERQLARNENGNNVTHQLIQEDEFLDWAARIMSLRQNNGTVTDHNGRIISGVLKTPHGDLLLHPSLRNNIFVKDFPTVSGYRGNYMLGYNYRRYVKMNYHRTFVESSLHALSEATCRILNAALLQEPDYILARMLEMLLAEDIYQEFGMIESYISREGLTRVCNLLLANKPGTWFYNVNLGEYWGFVQDLGYTTTAPLKPRLWRLMNHHGLLWTAERECNNRLIASPVVVQAMSQAMQESIRWLSLCFTDGALHPDLSIFWHNSHAEAKRFAFQIGTDNIHVCYPVPNAAPAQPIWAVSTLDRVLSAVSAVFDDIVMALPANRFAAPALPAGVYSAQVRKRVIEYNINKLWVLKMFLENTRFLHLVRQNQILIHVGRENGSGWAGENDMIRIEVHNARYCGHLRVGHRTARAAAIAAQGAYCCIWFNMTWHAIKQGPIWIGNGYENQVLFLSLRNLSRPNESFEVVTPDLVRRY